jgi:hypothetical protein
MADLKIKEYLTSTTVLRALKIDRMFKLFIVAREHVVGAALTQEEDRKEYVVASTESLPGSVFLCDLKAHEKQGACVRGEIW